ncbi:hypothetical protein VTN02DRAFT_2998 [Thermoascus thermophilus]
MSISFVYYHHPSTPPQQSPTSPMMSNGKRYDRELPEGRGDVFQYADGALLTFSLEANGSAVTDRQTAARTGGGRRPRTQPVRASFDRCSFLPSQQAVLSGASCFLPRGGRSRAGSLESHLSLKPSFPSPSFSSLLSSPHLPQERQGKHGRRMILKGTRI